MQHVLDKLSAEILDFNKQLPQLPVMQNVTPGEIREHLASGYDFSQPIPVDQLLDDVRQMMRRWNIQTTHPRYFGLFNPTTSLASVIADTLVALYNPQLATWSHAPVANEIEAFILNYLMRYFGYDPATGAANFTSGGAEANLSAVLVALTHHFDSYGDDGLLETLDAQPLIYLSQEAHDSFVKIAHMTGLGRKALRVIPVDDRLKMDISALLARYSEDRAAGHRPFMVVGTAGTTSAGVIDPLPELAELCETHQLWLHVDAAWGGAAVLSPRLRGYLRGIEAADSITCDAHKWFSVPMGAGMFFCRHEGSVSQTFRVSTAYMPGETREAVDPYVTTTQWSRRFIGLKLFMALAEAGVDNFAARIEHQTDMGDLLRDGLRASGWRIVNETPLPVVCFSHPQLDAEQLSRLLEELYAQGTAWISQARLKGDMPALRACITSYRTQAEDVAFLVETLDSYVPLQATTSKR